MKLKNVHSVVIIILCVFTLFACSQNFPAGEYWISGVITLPDHSGSTIPMSFKNVKIINGDSFNIKPGHVILLNSRFVVVNKRRTDSGTVQSWKLELMDAKTKKRDGKYISNLFKERASKSSSTRCST
jgi:hypothetical protein